MTKKTKIIALIFTTSLLITGGALAGYFTSISINNTQDDEPITKEETNIEDKDYDGSFSDFKQSIGYINPTTAIENFEAHFKVNNAVAGSEYFITNLESQTGGKIIELKFKVSKSINWEGQIVEDKILSTNLNLSKLSETWIENKTTEKTLKEFKELIGYTGPTTAIENFETHFRVNNGVDGARYFITNLETRNETKTIELKVKASKSIDSNGKEIKNKIFDMSLTVLKLPETSIKDKSTEKTLKEFKELIGYTNSTTAIENFESHFEVNGGIASAQYFITNLEVKNETKTIELKIKASKSIDSEGEEIDNRIFDVNLTVLKLPETSIKDKTTEKTLKEFKELIGYTNPTTAIENFESYFEVYGGISGAQYFITNLGARDETKTIELKIKVSKSIDSEGEEIDNRIFDVNLTVLKLPETSIEDKTTEKTLKEFKKLIGYTNSTTAIENFESHFEVNGGITGAQYFITNLETRDETKTIELKIKVSKSIDSEGEEIDNKIFDVNLTVLKLPETSIKDKTTEKTLKEFKELIGYTNPSTAIENFESHFEVNGGITGAQYFITNLETRNETRTIELKIKVSKSIDSEGEEIDNRIFDVNLTV
ncbi:MAG: hypothetical protein ACRC42_03895, partial [Mycoplasma sp.]